MLDHDEKLWKLPRFIKDEKIVSYPIFIALI